MEAWPNIGRAPAVAKHDSVGSVKLIRLIVAGEWRGGRRRTHRSSADSAFAGAQVEGRQEACPGCQATRVATAPSCGSSEPGELIVARKRRLDCHRRAGTGLRNRRRRANRPGCRWLRSGIDGAVEPSPVTEQAEAAVPQRRRHSQRQWCRQAAGSRRRKMPAARRSDYASATMWRARADWRQACRQSSQRRAASGRCRRAAGRREQDAQGIDRGSADRQPEKRRIKPDESGRPAGRHGCGSSSAARAPSVRRSRSAAAERQRRRVVARRLPAAARMRGALVGIVGIGRVFDPADAALAAESRAVPRAGSPSSGRTIQRGRHKALPAPCRRAPGRPPRCCRISTVSAWSSSGMAGQDQIGAGLACRLGQQAVARLARRGRQAGGGLFAGPRQDAMRRCQRAHRAGHHRRASAAESGRSAMIDGHRHQPRPGRGSGRDNR